MANFGKDVFRKVSLTYKQSFKLSVFMCILYIPWYELLQLSENQIYKCRYLLLNRVLFLSVVLYFKKNVKKLLTNCEETLVLETK